MNTNYEKYKQLNIDIPYENITKKQTIDINKFYSKMEKDSRQLAKNHCCYICQKNVDSFCNSHSIPYFILSNIAKSGKLYRTNRIINCLSPQEEYGLKQCGTFQLICRECDSVYFKNYENETSLINTPTNSLLCEIALKTDLHEIFTKKCDYFKFIKLSDFNPDASSQIIPSKIDCIEAEQNANYALKSINNNAPGYYCFFHAKLDFKAPIAFQNSVCLISDLKDEMINNVFNLDPSYKMKRLYINIFPLKDNTIIMLFVENNDKRYRKFRKQFNNLSFREQIKIINYIIFLYSDDIYISPMINESVFNDTELKRVFGKMPNYEVYNNNSCSQLKMIELATKDYSLSNIKNIPNLLSQEYSI